MTDRGPLVLKNCRFQLVFMTNLDFPALLKIQCMKAFFYRRITKSCTYLLLGREGISIAIALDFVILPDEGHQLLDVESLYVNLLTITSGRASKPSKNTCYFLDKLQSNRVWQSLPM